jgi:hypothetical protein
MTGHGHIGRASVNPHALKTGGLLTVVLAGVIVLMAAWSAKTELSTRRSVPVLVET